MQLCAGQADVWVLLAVGRQAVEASGPVATPAWRWSGVWQPVDPSCLNKRHCA